MRVALVCMPWAAAAEPSIALSLLKAIAQREGHDARIFYFNMDMAYRFGTREAYDRAAALPGVGDWLFREHVFGSAAVSGGRHEHYYDHLRSRGFGHEDIDALEGLRLRIPCFLDACMEAADWSEFDLVGFSMVFSQTLPSIALAKRIKERHPRQVIVCGGANCDGEMGEGIHRAFPMVDYVVSGEADRSFPALLRHLAQGTPPDDVRGLWHRRGGLSLFTGAAGPFQDLDLLPTPDYRDFFECSERLDTPAEARQVLWLEGSRGCWWGAKSHCTFCSLNDETIVQRNKTPGKILAEIKELADRHAPRLIKFTDNIMPLSHFKDLLPEIARLELDVLFFYETKANLKREQVRMLGEANVRLIQAGIESLSTRKLQLMKKGVRGIQNLQLLKWAAEEGVFVYWNWLHGVPGETDEDLAAEHAAMAAATHLYPPVGMTPIIMERFSPYVTRPTDHRIRLIGPDESYFHIFPVEEELRKKLSFSFQYEDLAPAVGPEWIARIEELVAGWRRSYEPQRLYYERGLGTTTITDRRFNHPARVITLAEERSEIYRYCDQIRSLEQVRSHLEAWSGGRHEPEEVSELLQEMVDLSIVYHEEGRYLSLALRYEPRYHLASICRGTLRESISGEKIAS
jgi:ribosomal peptide maturation radical SAM protein 1